MDRNVLFVSCTRGKKENTELYRSLRSLGLSVDILFFEHNSEGLPARYNSVLDAVGSDQLVAFVHDDIWIGDPSVIGRVRGGLDEVAVLGVVGSAAFTADAGDGVLMWISGPHEMWSGDIHHRTPEGVHRSTYGPTPLRCVVMDGIFLAVDPRQLNGIRFDPQFAFDFYDLDFCLTAHQAGLRLSTAPIAVTHSSTRTVTIHTPGYIPAQRAFVAKWGRRSFSVQETVTQHHAAS